MHICMQTHVDMHTGDLRVDLYKQLIDQFANTNQAESSSSLMFSLLIAGLYILIGQGLS